MGNCNNWQGETLYGFLTNEFRNAYKVEWSTIDVLYILYGQIENEGTGNLIIPDISQAFDAIKRDIMREVMRGGGNTDLPD